MKIVKRIATLLLALFMLIAGANHFISPETYSPLIPDLLPEALVNSLAGLVEVALGIGLLLPASRYWAAMGIVVLMIAFLPLHVWDVFRETPAMGSQGAAIGCMVVQFVFIAWAWWVWQSGGGK